MDAFAKLGCALVTALRGDRTQRQLSALIGFSAQKISKWETGLSRLYWEDFVSIARGVGLDLRRALGESIEYRGAPGSSAALFKVLTYDVSPKEACGWLECSRAQLGRWLGGQARLPLEVVFSLLERSGRLVGFVEHLVDVDSVPMMREITRMTSAARQVFATHPDAPLVLCALETNVYRRMRVHKQGWLSNFLGFSRTVEDAVIRALVAHKLVAFDGKKYFPLTYYTNIAWSSREAFAKTKKVKLHYFKRGLAALRQDQFEARSCSGGYEIFASSKETRELLRKENSAFYRRVHRILESTEQPTDGVTILQYQFIDLGLESGRPSRR